MSKKLPLVLFAIFTGVILEYVVLEIAALLPFIGENKSILSGDLLKVEALNIFQHPISTISTLIAEKNPLFFIGTGVVIIYMCVITLRTPAEKGWKAETENTTHGGARYAYSREIFIASQLKGANKKELLEQFKDSLKDGDNNGENGKH